jgi:hypothetical protein
MRIAEVCTNTGQVTLRRYKQYGLVGGIALGLLLGVLLSGPHFFEWSFGLSLAVISGCMAGCAAMGWFATAIATGSLAGGVATRLGQSDGANAMTSDSSGSDGAGGDGAC